MLLMNLVVTELAMSVYGIPIDWLGDHHHHHHLVNNDNFYSKKVFKAIIFFITITAFFTMK